MYFSLFTRKHMLGIYQITKLLVKLYLKMRIFAQNYRDASVCDSRIVLSGRCLPSSCEASWWPLSKSMPNAIQWQTKSLFT